MIIEAISGRTRQPIAVAIGRDADSIIRFMAVVYSGNAYVPLDFPSLKASSENSGYHSTDFGIGRRG